MRLKRSNVKLARQINIYASWLSDTAVQITIDVSELLDINARFISV